jgi:exodeoxyribonuclease VII large subunit
VGHEIDVTISDFVADLRAPTPSAAAELVSQNRSYVETQLQTIVTRLKSAMAGLLQLKTHQHSLLKEKLLQQDPKHKLQQQSLQLDELSLRLTHAIKQKLNKCTQKQQQLDSKLWHFSPKQTVHLELQKQVQLKTRLQTAMQNKLKQSEQELQSSLAQLNAVSPLATLARGYAIVKDNKGKVTTDASALAIGDTINVRLHKGEIKAQVL